MDKTLFDQAVDLSLRAHSRLAVARGLIAESSDEHYPEAMAACIDSIELAAKVVALCLVGYYPLEHDVTVQQKSRDFLENMRKAWLSKTKLPVGDLARLLTRVTFWSTFYTKSKYGFEALRVGANELFGKEELQMAIRHAEESNSTAFDALGWSL